MMADPPNRHRGLSSVLRRLVVDPAFASDVRTAAISALAEYDLAADELAALALLLDQPESGEGVVAFFDGSTDALDGAE